MERMAWTDERLEERFDGIDRRFDEVNRRFDEVEKHVSHRFNEIDRRLGEVDRRFDGVEGQIVELRQGMGALQATLNRAGFGIVASLMGVIAAILVKGG
jgi:tetrahydromethanopterin S-methyltransferase subunit G